MVKTKWKINFDFGFNTWCLPLAIHLQDNEMIIGILFLQVTIEKDFEIINKE